MDLIHCLKHCAALRAELDMPNEKYMDLTELHCVVLCRFPAKTMLSKKCMDLTEVHCCIVRVRGPDRNAL